LGELDDIPFAHCNVRGRVDNLGPEWGKFAGGVINISTEAGLPQKFSVEVPIELQQTGAFDDTPDREPEIEEPKRQSETVAPLKPQTEEAELVGQSGPTGWRVFMPRLHRRPTHPIRSLLDAAALAPGLGTSTDRVPARRKDSSCRRMRCEPHPAFLGAPVLQATLCGPSVQAALSFSPTSKGCRAQA
jgi:hypothetical protein